MIRPVHFGYNAETAVNNSFQRDTGNVQEKALQEFDAFVAVLRSNNLDVLVIDDSPNPLTPDSIFPNNWISFHADGTLVLYPMFAHNRRWERKQHVLDRIYERFKIEKMIDLSQYEKKDIFLEGTGSMVLDRENRIAYTCLSPRTHKEVLDEFCRLTGYSAVTFMSTDRNQLPIYHTNVMMCLTHKYAIVCTASITDSKEKNNLLRSLEQTNKELVDIRFEQLENFAGNMLQVESKEGESLLVMSSSAFYSLDKHQVLTLEKHHRIIHAPLDTIETAGGGSARCMLAEVFLSRR